MGNDHYLKAIESVGLGSISGLAGGISQALITTLAGLAVGIPSLMFLSIVRQELDTSAWKWREIFWNV